MYAHDTIAAIATPAGAGGIGIVRASGPLAPDLGSAIFRRSAGAAADWVSHHLYHGRIVDAGGQVVDEALAVLMWAPHSYTGETVLELHCHGSPIVVRRVLGLLLDAGARLAEPGEFTKRAFLNGRLDLSQAEAVIDLVRARTSAGASLAAAQLCGHLSNYLDTLRTDLVGLKALLEAQIDFAEEDLGVEPAQMLEKVEACAASVNVLLATFRHGKMVRDGLRVAIVGKPNVGKSSLLNALLGEDRAIVTAVAGTTRDAIDECIDFDGVPAMLSDTAGLRDADQADAVEKIGMQRTRSRIAGADLLLTVLDTSRPFDDLDRSIVETAEATPQVIVLNKADLPRVLIPADIDRWLNGRPAVTVSATRGLGLDEIRRRVVERAGGELTAATGRVPVVGNLRHAGALGNAAASLELARQSIRERRPADLIAVDVQDAIDHLGAVTGAITTEDVLDRVFSEFCIGK